jgi:hypothetical protein
LANRTVSRSGNTRATERRCDVHRAEGGQIAARLTAPRVTFSAT